MSFIKNKKVLISGYKGTVATDLIPLLKNHCNLIKFNPNNNIEDNFLLLNINIFLMLI